MSLSIVWLSDRIARVYHFSDDRMERVVLHLEAEWPESYDVLAGHLLNSKQILILSPGESGPEFLRRSEERFPDFAKRVVGCESLDNPDDAAVAAYAVKYFRKPLPRSV